MGKKIDGFVVTLLPGIALWLYLTSRMQNRIVPIIAAVFASILFGKMLRKISIFLLNTLPVRRKIMRRNACGAILRLAALPEEQALSDLRELMKKCYPGEDYALEIVQQHPSLKLSEGAVFQAWKKHAGEARLALCASCRTEPTVRAFAAGFSGPKITIVDSDMLSQMIAEHPEGLIPEKTFRTRMHLRHIANLLVNRRNAPRNLLFSASMLLMFLLTRNYFYLGSALFLLALCFLSLRKKLRPQKLF